MKFSDVIDNAEPNIIWADDNKTLFYIEKDPVTLLSKRVKTHVLGNADRLRCTGLRGSGRQLLHGHQPVPFGRLHLHHRAEHGQFRAALHVSRQARALSRSSRRVNGISNTAPTTSTAAGSSVPTGKAPNFRLMTLDANAALGDRKAWKELVPHQGDVFIEGYELFNGFVAIEERSNALLRVRTLADGKSEYVASDEPAYTMGLNVNAEPGTGWLRYAYTSLTTPNTIYEVNVKSGERKLLKRDPVLGGFNPDDYMTERQWATARDGTKIPVSLVYKKGFKKDGSAAMLQYAYGSYGLNSRSAFFNYQHQPAGPRRGVCHRPYPRRSGDGPCLV